MEKQPLTITRGDKSQLSPHFKANEWYSTSSDAPKSHPIFPQLIEAAEYLRNHFGVPWRVTSSYRTENHQRQICKEEGWKFFIDQHMQGKAFDSHPVDVGPAGQAIKEQLYADFIENGPIYQALRQIGITGFGIYDWGIHLDCRNNDFLAKRKDKYGYVACWDSRTNAKKKFGGAAVAAPPTPPQTSKPTPSPTSPKPSSSATLIAFPRGVPAGPGSSAR